MTVQDLIDKTQVYLGDGTRDFSDEFIINCLNYAYNELPLVPKLGRIFSRHYTKRLKSIGHYRWLLNGDFRRLSDTPYLYFWSSTGGDPCPLNICNRDNATFFAKNGLIEAREAGTPCEYTIEQEDDDIYLVVDRPLNIPIIIDYEAYGFPKPVRSTTDTVKLSTIAENLVLQIIRSLAYMEMDDMSFSMTVEELLDNRDLARAVQELNKRWRVEAPTILGEV